MRRILSAAFIDKKKIKLGDIGGAAGEFGNYISAELPAIDVINLEYNDDLVSASLERFPNLSAIKFDVLDGNALEKNSFDAFTMLGVLSIFDDYEKVVSNIVAWLRPGGRLILHGMFNDYDLDVYVRYKKSAENYPEDLESGWNIISVKSLKDLLASLGNFEVNIEDFSIGIDLEKDPDDPVRSWSETDAFGERYITNGLCLKQPQKFIEIIKL